MMLYIVCKLTAPFSTIINSIPAIEFAIEFATEFSTFSIRTTFRDEWDATVLQNAKMAKDTTMNAEELNEKLYHHDAACRIIARLTQQMAETRATLIDVQKEAAAEDGYPEDQEMPTEEEAPEKGITDAIMEKLKQTGDVSLANIISEKKLTGVRWPFRWPKRPTSGLETNFVSSSSRSKKLKIFSKRRGFSEKTYKKKQPKISNLFF